jgi:hypothetical protein
MPNDDLHTAMARLSYELWRQGQSATRRRSYVEGTTLRGTANRIRQQLGLPPFPYHDECPSCGRPFPAAVVEGKCHV